MTEVYRLKIVPVMEVIGGDGQVVDSGAVIQIPSFSTLEKAQVAAIFIASLPTVDETFKSILTDIEAMEEL